MIRITIGALVAACAFGALTATALATGTFGEFKAQVAGGLAPSPTEPGVLKLKPQEEPELTGLRLGNFRFGAINAGLPEYEEPCEKSLKVTGQVTTEKSPSLEFDLHFRRCVTSIRHNGGTEAMTIGFTLAMKLNANHTAEVLEVAKPATGLIRTAQRKCPIAIPPQTIPFKINPAREYEGIVGFTPESEPIENWEKSRTLKEVYPSGVRERLGIQFGEKFKGLRTYVEPVSKSISSCVPVKGEENPKLITEEGPYQGWLEYKSGYIYANIEGIEVKKGELTFEPS